MSEPSSESTRLFSIQELSARSGVPIVTLRRWAKAGRIPFFQPSGKNGRLLFSADAIQASIHSIPTSVRSAPRVGRRPKWES
ncbi:helix-turn-helix domain-containing protein [Blastopirellula sp. J2-11]|uniref:helix-turn-helix domain-containing protein n=1 Tax=Blastopirellula sp. J2-11 TaxID=2943192 RepID=UPI003966A4AD